MQYESYSRMSSLPPPVSPVGAPSLPSQGDTAGGVLRIEEYEHPREFAPDLLAFINAAEVEGVELGTTWQRNLIDTVFPAHPGVRFYVLRRGAEPVAVLPLLVEKSVAANEIHALSNFYCALYAPVVRPDVDGQQMAMLLRHARAMHGSVSLFRFAPMDPASHAFACLHAGLRAAGLVPFKFFSFGNWYMPVDTAWPDYLAARDGVLRSTIKRMGKKFANAGGTLQLITGGDQLERGIAAYEKVYASSWKIPEPFPGFMPGLMRACAERGWLRLGVAWLANEPIAAQLWIVGEGKAAIYKLAYHEDHKAYAPGTLLTTLLMQHAMEVDKVAEIDYLIGDDAYKKSWMNCRRERWGIVAYNPRSPVGLFKLGKETAGRAWKSWFPARAAADNHQQT